MNQKKHYVSDEPVPIHHDTITVRGKLLESGTEVTLERGIGYPTGRYRFCWAEQRGDVFMLMFFGPTRRAKQRYREVWDDSATVRTVHHG